MYFQDLILTLQSFWTSRGCVLVQPYNSEVGAGTYNPATFLRLDNELGRIAPGCRADLVLLDADFNVQATWISGARQDEVKS